MKFLILLILSIFVFTISLPAQDGSQLSELLNKETYDLALTNGKLTGKGAEFLIREAKTSQFFLIGESHGIAEMPRLTTAMFRELNKFGYNNFAIETGPITARRMERIAKKPNGFATFNTAYPFALPFFNLREEAKMIEDVLKLTKFRKDTLWGLDQEFAASPHFHLVRLYELAPNEKAKSILKPYYDLAKTEYQRIVKTKNPTIAFLSSAQTRRF